MGETNNSASMLWPRLLIMAAVAGVFLYVTVRSCEREHERNQRVDSSELNGRGCDGKQSTGRNSPSATPRKDDKPSEHEPTKPSGQSLDHVLGLSGQDLKAVLDALSLDELLTLRAKLLAQDRNDDVELVTQVITAREKLSDALARYEALAALDRIAERNAKPGWPPDDSSKIDNATMLDLDMDRVVGEQTPESLALLLDGMAGLLPFSVINRLKTVLPDGRRMEWLRGIRANAADPSFVKYVDREVSLYPAASGIDRARLDAFARLQTADISDKDFTAALLGPSTSYYRAVLVPVARRMLPEDLLASAVTDLEALLAVHQGRTGRHAAISLLLGACDGLSEWLHNRVPGADHRPLIGSSRWCWLSGVDEFVLSRHDLARGETSSDAAVQAWLAQAGTMRESAISLPRDSFQAAWDFVTPIFEVGGSHVPEFLLTPEFGSWFRDMCDPAAVWLDGERCDPLMFLTRNRAPAATLASFLVRSVKLASTAPQEEAKRLIIAVLTAPTAPGWIHPQHPGPNGMQLSLWHGVSLDPSAAFFKGVQSMTKSATRDEIEQALATSLPDMAQGDWREVVAGLLEKWSGK